MDVFIFSYSPSLLFLNFVKKENRVKVLEETSKKFQSLYLMGSYFCQIVFSPLPVMIFLLLTAGIMLLNTADKDTLISQSFFFSSFFWENSYYSM